MKLGLGLGLAYGLGGNFSSGPIPTLYVDSVNGLDTNDGLTAGTALKTLTAARSALVAGEVVGLARGSSWREMMDIRTVADVAFIPYGTGDIPEISGADVIAPNLFTPSAHADAGGVTYEYAWTRGTGYESGTDKVMLWEDDARLYRRASVALVAANPGSYYAVSEEAASTTIYAHPYGSTDPRSDGKTYEVTKRGAGIDSYSVGAAGCTVNGIHIKKAWSHTGPMSGPWNDSDSSAKKIIIGGGGLHHIVTSVPLCEDLILHDVAKNYGTEFFPYTAYYENGAGLVHTARRVISIGDSGADTASKTFNGGLYSHGTTSGYDTVKYEQCSQTYSNRGFSCNNPEIIVDGCYTSNVTTAVTTTNNTTSTVRRLIANSSLEGVSDSGPVDAREKNRLIENCVVNVVSGGSGFGAAVRNGTLTIRNCVVIGDFATSVECSVDTGLTIIIERCIFVRSSGSTYAHKPRIGTGSYTGINNVFWRTGASSVYQIALFSDGVQNNKYFDEWKALGYDANSLAIGAYNGYNDLTDLFVEDPRTNGNYTLRTDTGLLFGDGSAITTAGPQEHWDWNARAVAIGPPTAFPTLPTTLADMKAYVNDPTAWDFYP